MAYIPEDLYPTLKSVVSEMRREGISFAIGGGTAVSTYLDRWRGTKDIDLYVVPADRERTIQVLNRSGLADYYETLPYDRAWIYRSFNHQTIVDVIWAMANHSAQIDQRWLTLGPVVQFHDECVRLVPAEELIFAKLYVLQRDRCDWPDILNLLEAVGPGLDWARLVERLGADGPLLGAALEVFGWLAPARAAQLPAWVLEHFRARPHATGVPVRARADLLDRRPWYVPTIVEKAA